MASPSENPEPKGLFKEFGQLLVDALKTFRIAGMWLDWYRDSEVVPKDIDLDANFEVLCESLLYSISAAAVVEYPELKEQGPVISGSIVPESEPDRRVSALLSKLGDVQVAAGGGRFDPNIQILAAIRIAFFAARYASTRLDQLDVKGEYLQGMELVHGMCKDWTTAAWKEKFDDVYCLNIILSVEQCTESFARKTPNSESSATFKEAYFCFAELHFCFNIVKRIWQNTRELEQRLNP